MGGDCRLKTVGKRLVRPLRRVLRDQALEQLPVGNDDALTFQQVIFFLFRPVCLLSLWFVGCADCFFSPINVEFWRFCCVLCTVRIYAAKRPLFRVFFHLPSARRHHSAGSCAEVCGAVRRYVNLFGEIRIHAYLRLLRKEYRKSTENRLCGHETAGNGI